METLSLEEFQKGLKKPKKVVIVIYISKGVSENVYVIKDKSAVANLFISEDAREVNKKIKVGGFYRLVKPKLNADGDVVADKNSGKI